jgi:hypothetical protein
MEHQDIFHKVTVSITTSEKEELDRAIASGIPIENALMIILNLRYGELKEELFQED